MLLGIAAAYHLPTGLTCLRGRFNACPSYVVWYLLGILAIPAIDYAQIAPDSVLKAAACAWGLSLVLINMVVQKAHPTLFVDPKAPLTLRNRIEVIYFVCWLTVTVAFLFKGLLLI